jgi:predicted dehydrogenase
MRTINVGIIGCGLMGREFASAAARWAHLHEMEVRPNLVAICDPNEGLHAWYKDSFPSVRQSTKNYKDLLENEEIQVVYVAVPHHLHAEVYTAVIDSGKHLLGEKPFGIDLKANQEIMACIEKHPEVFVRCASQFPFFPAMQKIGAMIDDSAFGQIIEVQCGLLHSSDLNEKKPINWKRMIDLNGEYGCMGDLGMHACHMPFRAGWFPKRVRSFLSNIVKERPNSEGDLVPCETWDNALMLCDTVDPQTGETFPMTIKTYRIAPGNKNSWYMEITGTQACAKWTTEQANTLSVLEYTGGQQNWQRVDMGHEVTFPSITSRIFEMGFSDAILQMWGAFFYELHNGKPLSRFAGCATPAEVAMSHQLFTAALKSHDQKTVITI